MSDQQRYLESSASLQQVRIGIATAVGLGVLHYDVSNSAIVSSAHDIMDILRVQRQITIVDPDKILNTGPGVPIGYTIKRWVGRDAYVQAAQLLGAQTIDVMRQITKK